MTVLEICYLVMQLVQVRILLWVRRYAVGQLGQACRNIDECIEMQVAAEKIRGLMARHRVIVEKAEGEGFWASLTLAFDAHKLARDSRP